MISNTTHETLSNRPAWQNTHTGEREAFQEVWYLKLNDPKKNQALWLRFTLLHSKNGFRKIAENWGIFFERIDESTITKTALKQTYPIQEFVASPNTQSGFQLGPSQFSDQHTAGAIRSKGQTIKWDLAIERAQDASFNFVPQTLSKMKIVSNTAMTVGSDLRFTGDVWINDKKYTFQRAPGMQGHLYGPKNGHSWVWGHCNSFVDPQGKAVDFVFDGLTAKAKLPAQLHTPALSALFFSYEGEQYHFNHLWDSVKSVKSQHSLTEWNFRADRKDISFHGTIKARIRDFVGLTYEDTDGTFLYCNNSKLSDMKIHIYRHEKLERTLIANGTAALEVVEREKNRHVPVII